MDKLGTGGIDLAVSIAKPKTLPGSIRTLFNHLVARITTSFLRSLLVILIAVLWARASLFGEFHPFALAALAITSLIYPQRLFEVIIGTLIGFGLCFSCTKLASYAALAIPVLIGAGLAKRQGNTISYQLIFGSFYTAAAVLIGRIILATAGGEEPVFLYFALLEAILAGLLVGVLSYFGTRLKTIAAWQQELEAEEIALGALILGISISGLDGLTLGLVQLVDLSLRLAVILAAWIAGPGAGAIAGIGIGVVVGLLSNYSPYQLAGLAMAGIAAGLFRALGKGGLIVGFFAGAGLLAYQLLTPAELSGMIASTLVAAVIVGLIPPETIATVQGWLPAGKLRNPRELDEEQRVKSWLSRRLSTFSEVLGELARSFAQLPQEEVVSDNPDISKMINAVSARVCSGCQRYQSCWVDRFYITFKNFEITLVEAENNDGLQLTQLPQGIKSHCTQTHKLVQAVNYLLELHRVESTWEKKLLSSREIVSTQLQGVAEVISSLSKEMLERRYVQENPSKELLAAFVRKRCAVQQVRAVAGTDGQYEIRVTCVNCGGKEACRQLASIASVMLDTQYSVGRPACGYLSGEPLCEVSLLPKKAYQLEYQVVKTSKKGSKVNGDNHLLLALPSGKIGVALSDGMGSGSRAALESSTTLSLLEQLLRAGLDKQFALRALNSLLLFRSPEETFATLDLMLFDEYTGEAEFVKVGCQPTYIIRGSDILRIEGQSLPIGIVSQFDAAIISEELYPNDYIVMITDGVTDCAPGLTAEWFEKLLAHAPKLGAAEVADYLLAKVLDVCAHEPQDDLTIAVARVRSKGMGANMIPVYTRRRNTAEN